MESVKDFRMTSDEAPLHGGGGMQYAPLALPRRRLLWAALALGGVWLLGGLLLVAGCGNPAKSHFDRGMKLEKRCKYEEAEREFRVAVRLKPDYAWAYFVLAGLLEEQGKTEEAVVAYREVTRLKPDELQPHLLLGKGLLKLGKTEEATAAYRKCADLEPHDVEILEKLAVILDNQGKRKEARKYWVRAEKLEARVEWLNRIKARLAEPD